MNSEDSTYFNPIVRTECLVCEIVSEWAESSKGSIVAVNKLDTNYLCFEPSKIIRKIIGALVHADTSKLFGLSCFAVEQSVSPVCFRLPNLKVFLRN